MEGYAVRDILADEVANIFPIFAASFLIIEAVTLIAAATLYQTALPQYILFSLPNIAMLIIVVFAGLLLSALLICRQNSAEHIKGRVPRRGIYITTILAKGVFVGFIIFSCPSPSAMLPFHIIPCRLHSFLRIKWPGM